MTATLVQSTTAPSSRTQKRVEVDGPPELPRKGAHPFPHRNEVRLCNVSNLECGLNVSCHETL